MSVTLEQIKKLRDATGVSTMACKKALEEANGDQEKAVEILRKTGEAKSQARAERSTSQGVISVAEKSDKAAIINLACETDFVARNEDFIASAKKIAEELLKNESYDSTQIVNDLNLKLGEKIEVKDTKFVEGKVLGTYIHSNNKIGVVVALTGGEVETAKDIAMHVAAMNPAYLNPEEVSEISVTKEKEIWTDQLKKEGKPEQIWDKIMIGKEKKFREENALTKQPFVKNPEITVEKLLGTNKIEKFIRLSV
ncbi:MAG: translation elongation factor Ts [Candidatus Gracilibacteria bacterium]|jgi:elongation factor Ts